MFFVEPCRNRVLEEFSCHGQIRNVERIRRSCTKSFCRILKSKIHAHFLTLDSQILKFEKEASTFKRSCFFEMWKSGRGGFSQSVLRGIALTKGFAWCSFFWKIGMWKKKRPRFSHKIPPKNRKNDEKSAKNPHFGTSSPKWTEAHRADCPRTAPICQKKSHRRNSPTG